MPTLFLNHPIPLHTYRSNQTIVRDPTGFCDVRHQVLHTSSSSNRGCQPWAAPPPPVFMCPLAIATTLSFHVCNLLCIVYLQWSSSCWLGLHHQHHAVTCVKTARLWARSSTRTTPPVGASTPSTTSTASTSTSVTSVTKNGYCLHELLISLLQLQHLNCDVATIAGGMLAFDDFSILSAMLPLILWGMLQYI